MAIWVSVHWKVEMCTQSAGHINVAGGRVQSFGECNNTAHLVWEMGVFQGENCLHTVACFERDGFVINKCYDLTFGTEVGLVCVTQVYRSLAE